MRKVMKDAAKARAAQAPGGRGPEEIHVQRLSGAGASMVVPGDGKPNRAIGARKDRSAAHYGDATGRMTGAGNV